MPKISIFAIPLKKSSEIDVLKPLKNLIASRYQSSEQEGYVAAINEFAKLRTAAVGRTLDVHENSLEALYKYYDQLCALESKIPANELQLSFKWKDAFDRGGFFGGRLTLSISSISYEKVCVLFNIAAMQTQVAATQSCNTDESLKLAAKLLQSASGIFAHLQTIVHGSLQQEPTPDLQPECLQALSAICLAQAQEVFFHKAVADQMKPAIIAKLAHQCGLNYSTALGYLLKDNLSYLCEKDWPAKVAGKETAFMGLAQFYQSRVCNATKAVGEEIARLKCAIDTFKEAASRSMDPSVAVNFSEEIGRCNQYHAEAVKDNDFIYHERIPDLKKVAPIGTAAIAKPTPVPASFCSNFTDLFATLVPVVIQQALAQYDVRKQEIVNGEVGKLRESTQFLNSVLVSLNLPAAIEDTAGEKLPQSLREKALAIGDKGGLKTLDKLLEELPNSLKRNRELLNECERMLREEKESDDQLRTQFKEKWTRTPSDKLTTSFQANADKYRKVIETAVQADSTIHEKHSKHLEGMTLLSQGPEAIASALPLAANPSGNVSSPAAHRLKQHMEDVETIKAERDAIESELKSTDVDMRSTFVNALANEGTINEAVLSVESLGRTYGPLQKQVQESLTRQETLISDIQKAHMEFSGAGVSGGDRENLLKKLASAHDAFNELLGNLQEGNKFYNDLTQLLVSFQTKISDFCFARKTEKDELMKDLTQAASQNVGGSAPNAPTHHQEAPKSAPPPRPPPPTTQPSPLLQNYPYPTQAPQAPAVVPTQAQQPAQAPQAPPQGNLPYPLNPQGMPTPVPPAYGYPVYTPMPQGFNPYFTQTPPMYSPYPVQPQQGYPQAPAPQYPGYPQYPPPSQ